MTYEFTNGWFNGVKPVWEQIFSKINPTKVLEIGSFEGQSTSFIIEQIAKNLGTVFCIDTWEGGKEHDPKEMPLVEKRFYNNIGYAKSLSDNSVNVIIKKGYSHIKLVELLNDGHRGTFDLIYVDGSHQAPDVLSDLVLSYQLCKVGGMIIADNYLWFEGGNPVMEPKLAIDAFTNVYRDKLSVWRAPLYQMYFTKTA